MDIAALLAIVAGIIALSALVDPRLGPYVYRTEWPGYQTNVSRRRRAYVMCGGFAVAFTCLGIAALLGGTRHDSLIVASFVPLGLAFVSGFVGLAAATWLRSSRR